MVNAGERQISVWYNRLRIVTKTKSVDLSCHCGMRVRKILLLTVIFVVHLNLKVAILLQNVGMYMLIHIFYSTS